MSSFRGTNYITVNNTFGPGMKIEKVESVLLAICKHKTQPIYIGKDRTLDLSGNTFLGRSQQLFNIANELQKDYGTENPESVVNEDGKLYCFDRYRGVVWRYTTGGGQEPISEYGMQQYFLGKAKIAGYESAAGGYQREFATYYLKMGKELIAFQDKNGDGQQVNKWSCFFEFDTAEVFGWTGMYFVSIKDGSLWRHELGDYANYFGDQKDVSITLVVNNDPNTQKLFMNVMQMADAIWEIEEINIPAASPYNMKSQLPENKWKTYEGQHRADFLRDQSDPYSEFASLVNPEKTAAALLRGRFLRGEVATIKLRLTEPTKNNIFRKLITETKI
jgi:hypothetical protein